MSSPIDLEYLDHTLLKLSIDRPHAIGGLIKVEINSKLSIAYFKDIKEVQFFFTHMNIGNGNSLKFDILQAAKYKIRSDKGISKESLTAFSSKTLLPLLWAIMIQILSTNLHNFGIDEVKFPLRDHIEFKPDQVHYKEIKSIENFIEKEN